ncbi:MAG: SDR family NAD(P)-dependent oxidoreductase [Alphaproteobacteria bacterium]
MTAHNIPPKTIIITGASSGIGQELAKYYAQKGITLGLIGRNQTRLDQTATICREQGAHVITKIIDVRKREELITWMKTIDDQYPVDLLIANAGISAGTGNNTTSESPEQIHAIFDINLYGVLNTIEALQARMIERGHGQIALLGSLAGFKGWPGAPAYCASKAAVKTYGEALRGALRKTGVRVNVICPGFIKSAITDANDFPMPFLMNADKAAQIIAKGLHQNKGQIAFPIATKGIVWLSMVIPYRLSEFLLSFSPSKKHQS